MALTWTQTWTKAQRLAQTNNSDVLVQLKEDINTGYHLFNQKLSRYYTRKQQFTDLIANQQIYQTPVDCVRVEVMTVLVSNTLQPPVKEVRGEYEWRQIVSYPYTTNWPAWYFMIGNDELSLWPIPSQNVTNGLRFVYQPQDHDLTVEDVTSTSTSSTVTVTNGSTMVTADSSTTPFNVDMKGLFFQVTGVQDNTWYEIVNATTSTLTLKSKYVATSNSTLQWRVGQLQIIPQEYNDAPIHYALMNYWSAQGNEARSNVHLNTFETMTTQCMEDYSSANESMVITDDEIYLNPYTIPPIPNP